MWTSGLTNTQRLEPLEGFALHNWGLNSNAKSFNHAILLPQQNGQSFPLFNYEQMLYGTLQKHKHVWIKKVTGLGITEFMLRFM